MLHFKLPVLITALYGLRRSETLGLKWDAIDFENKPIVIRHTISQTKVDGKLQIVAEDYNTTANIYTHVDVESKQFYANVMGNAFDLSATY